MIPGNSAEIVGKILGPAGFIRAGVRNPDSAPVGIQLYGLWPHNNIVIRVCIRIPGIRIGGNVHDKIPGIIIKGKGYIIIVRDRKIRPV